MVTAEISPPARLLLVRHGETVWNLEGRMQGHLDSPLSERGVEQARRLAQRLVAARPVALYASDLGRIDIEPERWTLVTWGDVAYLEGEGSAALG